MDGMTATDQGGKSFFEILPPEIRDQIYDFTMFQDIQREDFNFRFRAPCLHLRLVNRQFKNEYDKRPMCETTLEASFPTDFPEPIRYIDAPGLAARCTSLQLNHLFQKGPHAHEMAPGWFAIECCRVMLRLAPISLQHLDIYLVWDSVQLLKDYVFSQFSNQLHHCITHMVKGQYDSNHGLVPSLKLRYGGISSSNTSMRSKCDVLGAELLIQPATLGTWSVKDRCFLLDDDRINERLRMETLVEAATEAVMVRNQELPACRDQ
jgi:hypothetical protein